MARGASKPLFIGPKLTTDDGTQERPISLWLPKPIEDEHQGDPIEDPTRMPTAGRPQIADRAEGVGTCHQDAGHQLALMIEAQRGYGQHDPAEQPVERA